MRKKNLKSLTLKKVIVSGLQENIFGGVDTGAPGSMKLGGTCDGGGGNGSISCITSYIACDHLCATEDGNSLCT